MVELIWDGKYDENGKRVAPLRVELPFQTVETINESAQHRQKMLNLFGTQKDNEWRNRLIWGDKKYVLPSLLPEFAGKVDLIYIDPPFNVGADFSYQTNVGDKKFEKKPSMIEEKAYRDTWGSGLDSYLSWFYETTLVLYELLSETGSLYVHLDWHAGHYAKTILDEIFGENCFVNEIIWHYRRWPTPSPMFQRMHDTIFLYEKNEGKRNFNKLYGERSEATLRRWKNKKIVASHDEDGRRIPSESEQEDSKGAPLSDVWEISIIAPVAHERVGYPTQKPEALLERIISASSNEGDLVLDAFCGSGTTASVAEKLGRRWITCDLGRFAIHTARKRLLAIEGVKPFVVQNLGKYERQVWQEAQFGEDASYVVRQYRRFILELYDADPIDGYTWIHGKKGGRLVHVGSVDSPVAEDDVRKIAIEFRKLVGTGDNAPKEATVDILGWDFAFELNEVQKQLASEAQIKLRFVRIPREILEQKAVDQGDIKFFELAALSADVTTKARSVHVTLTDFMVSPDDVPDDVIKAVKHWSEWVDYWAVDFNYRDDTFHNEWQSYRTRQDRSLELDTSHQYKEAGHYIVLVKVIDILGNDTTKAFEIKVG